MSTSVFDMLLAKNLCLSYENEVLSDISFAAGQGDISVFIGPSGCGKTSLLNILAGNVKNYAGSVTLDGEPINYKTRAVGLVAQDYGLLPWKTVYKNIVLPINIKKLRLDDYEEKISRIMEILQIKDIKNRFPSQLSGGQKQRVALAKTFILDLDLLLMDEPFSALDSITREQAQKLFLDIWEIKKPVTVFVTHSIDEAVFLGSSIKVLSPLPCQIIETIENPLFDIENKRSNPLFHKISTKIRRVLAKGLCHVDKV